MATNLSNTFTCPNCGEDVPKKAKACPHCGSDENTGWSEDTYLDGIDLPEDFDYDQFLENEGLAPRRQSQSVKQRMIGIIALLLIILFYLFYIHPNWIK